MIRPNARSRRGLYIALVGGLAGLTALAVYNRADAEAVPRIVSCWEPGGRQIHVSTRAELQQALSDASGGFTIELAPGDYGALRLTATPDTPRFARTVTIRSADPRAPARFRQLTLNGFSNIVLQALRFEYPGFFDRPREEMFAPNGSLKNLDLLRTDNVSDITIRDSTFAGPTTRLAGGDPTDGFGYGFGWKGKDIRNAVFTNNELTNLYKAVSLRLVDVLEITDNSMHDYRSDSIYIAQAKDLTIRDNYMADPRPRLLPKGQGDHPDFIQLEDVAGGRIENNYMDIGITADESQGIFSRAASNMVVRNNVIATRSVNALTFASLTNSEIANNLVINAVLPPGLARVGTGRESHEPMLRIRRSYNGVRVADNISSKYNHDFLDVARGPQIAVSNNVLVQNYRPGGANFYHYATEGAAVAPAGALRIGNVSLSGVPAGTGPDPAKFAFLARGSARSTDACRQQ